MTLTLAACLYVSAAIFSIGAYGVLSRQNALVMLMSLELMLNAVNLAIIALGRAFVPARLADPSGTHVLVLVVLAVAAAEAAVGLSIVLAVFRKWRSTQTSTLDSMRW